MMDSNTSPSTPSTETIVKLTHASRFYGTVIGVGDLNIELNTGAYGLVGPNGSGKTTFINLLSGLLEPTLGAVELFGKDPVKNRTEVLPKLGLCPASDILYPNISALQWVTYLTELHGFSHSEATDRACQSLVTLGMEKNMRRPIGNYSLGMRQRTKLAQAVAHDPELLVLDEPFNGLDPIARFELTDFLKQWKARGKSLVLASHILHEVEAITTSFLLIHGGRVLASGDASEVRSMVRGFPAEVQIRGVGLEHVAREVVGPQWIQGLEFKEQGSVLHVSVADKEAFLDCLNSLVCQPEVNIQGLDSPDNSLEDAFDLLLSVHRGEKFL